MRRYIAIGAAIGTVLGTIIGKLFALLSRFFRFIFSLISEKISEKREAEAVEASVKNNTTPINGVTPFQQFFIDKYKKMEAEGKKIEWYYVEQTTNSNYPYPCATENEKNFMDDGKKPLKDGYLPAAYRAMIYYGIESDTYLYYDLDKKEYWKNHIVTSAKNGDRWCQALLVAAEKGFMQSEAWCTPEENAQWKELYEDTLINDARFGDPCARIGVAWAGLDNTRNDNDKKERYYRLAGESGYSDGYFLLAEHIELKDYNETGKIYTYGDKKSCAYYNLINLAAEADNGILAGWCQHTIGDMYLSGECGFEKNPQKAKIMYQKALSNGFERALSSLDTTSAEELNALGDELYDKEKYDKAFELYTKAFEKDPENKEILFNLGFCYRKGFGVEKNDALARELFMKSAKKGHKRASYWTADYYYTDRNPLCIEWWKKATELGDDDAPHFLAISYRDGEFVEQSIDKAVEYYNLAIERGNFLSMLNMGNFYIAGEYVEKNITKGIDLLIKASEENDTFVGGSACYHLSLLYLLGQNVTTNAQLAYDWAVRGAQKGDHRALQIIGSRYANGTSPFEKDYTKAFNCFLLCSQCPNVEDPDVFESLAKCYLNGFGTEIDKVAAAKEFEKAAELGSEDAQKNLKDLYTQTAIPTVNSVSTIPTTVVPSPQKRDDTIELPTVPLESTNAIASDEESQPDKKAPLLALNKKPIIIVAIALLLLVIGIIAISQKGSNLAPTTEHTEEADDSIFSDELNYGDDNSDSSDSKTPDGSQNGVANDAKDMFFMPDVIYEDVNTATDILSEKGLVVTIEHTLTDDYTENTVIEQSILPGSEAYPGDIVSLVIASKTPTIESINVVGEKQSVAVSALEEQGFNVIVMDMFDSDVPEGKIISQHPEGGSSQAPGSDVVIYVSKGTDTVKMPNVVNKHIDDAESLLSSIGLYVNIEYEKTDSVKLNYVIRQNIKKGKEIERGTSVTLVVASGRETIDVANVVGKTSASAESVLSGQGFYITITEKYDSTVQKGYVISQSPSAGTAQLPDSTITIYVSKGKQPVTVYFNANGGKTPSSQKTVYLTDTYGSLPTPTKTGYSFNGWYTATSGGQKITSSTTVSSSSSHTLYAVWTLNPPSDWVFESEVPAGAEILSTRYVYDKTTRETKTSTSSSLSGWTRYDKKTETIYKNVTYYNYVVYGLYHNGDYTYAFSDTKDKIITHCKNSFNYDPYAVCYKITYSTTSKLQNGVKGNYNGCTATSLDGKKTVTVNIKNTVLFENGTSTKKVANGTKTTYYYERYTTESNLISESYPTSSASNVTISNVRKQVKYRAK